MKVIKTFFTSYQSQVIHWQDQFNFVQSISLGFRLSTKDWLEEHEVENELRSLLGNEPLDECFPKQQSDVIFLSSYPQHEKILISDEEFVVDKNNQGLISISDSQRQKHLGKYNRKYLQDDFPGLPNDCNPAYFQRVSESLQLSRNFHPNEFIQLLPHKICTHLPNLIPRIFHLRNTQFTEVSATADTLILAPEQDIGVISWCHQSLVGSFDAREVKLTLIALDHPQKQRSFSHFQHAYQNRSGQQASHYALKSDDLLPAYHSESRISDSAPIILAESKAHADLQRREFKPLLNILKLQKSSFPSRKNHLDDEDFSLKTFDAVNCQNQTFKHCNFKSSELKQCQISLCKFIDCDFSETQFHETQFRQCLFDHCRFEKGQIKSSDFYFSNFDRCHWQWLTIKRSSFRQTDWKHLVIDRCLFLENDFSGAWLERTHVHDGDFNQSHWHYSIFKQVNWQNNRHQNAVFYCATSQQSNFYGSHFQKCLIEESDFSENQFTKAKFSNSQILDSNVSNADFSKTHFLDCRINQNQASSIGMANSVWKDSELQQNDFSVSIFLGASFTDCGIEANNFELSELSYLAEKRNHWKDNDFNKTILSAQKREPENAAIE